MLFAFSYQDTPLHVTRTVIGFLYCMAFVLIGLLFENPVILLLTILLIFVVSYLAKVNRQILRAFCFSLPILLLVVIVNSFVSRNGLTVIFYAGEIPWWGQFEVTLEAVVYGFIMALKVLVIMLAFALYTAVINPDGVLSLLRRVGFRSALTAVLTTRLLPVLQRDGLRILEAQKTLASDVGNLRTKTLVLKASFSNALDRAVDLAATLELRGYGHKSKTYRIHKPWSRHDLNFFLSALMIIFLTIFFKLSSFTFFSVYPQVKIQINSLSIWFFLLLALVVLFPFLSRKGIAR